MTTAARPAPTAARPVPRAGAGGSEGRPRLDPVDDRLRLDEVAAGALDVQLRRAHAIARARQLDDIGRDPGRSVVVVHAEPLVDRTQLGLQSLNAIDQLSFREAEGHGVRSP